MMEKQNEIIQKEFEYYRDLANKYAGTPNEQKYTYKMQALRDAIKKIKKLDAKKYYFVYYSCYARVWHEREIMGPATTQYVQGVIDVHPIQWQIEVNEKYSPEHATSGGLVRSEYYTVISWQDLTPEEYERFKGMVG